MLLKNNVVEAIILSFWLQKISKKTFIACFIRNEWLLSDQALLLFWQDTIQRIHQ